MSGTPGRGVRRLVALAAGLASTAVVMGACSSGTSSAPSPIPSAPGPPASSSPASSPPTSAPAAGAPASPHAQLVAVQMTEFHLALPSTTLAPGTYTFDAINAGQMVHALSIDGPGLADQRTGTVQPGASAPLTVTLAPGTYDMYCPIGNHKALGMNAVLTVTAPGGGPAPTSTAGGNGGS